MAAAAAAAMTYGPSTQEEQVGAELGTGLPQAPLLIGLSRLLNGHVHGLLLYLQAPLKLLVDMIIGGLLKEEILNLLPELGVRGQHCVKVDSDLWGGHALNRVSHSDAGALDWTVQGQISGHCCCPLGASSTQGRSAVMRCLLHPFGCKVPPH